MSKPENRGAPGTHPFDDSFVPAPEGVVERLGGDELGARIATHYPPEIGLRRLVDRHQAGFFWKALEGQLAECDAIMSKHGRHRTTEKPGQFPGDRDSDPYSELWYAGTIGALCWMVLSWKGKGQLPEVALARIMEIGIRVTEWQWREGYKPYIVTGHKQRKALKGLRSAENDRKKLRVTLRRAAIVRFLSGTRLTNGLALTKYLQKQLPAEGGEPVSLRTIRRDLMNIREQS